MTEVYLKTIGKNLVVINADGRFVKRPGTHSLWSFHGRGEAERCLKKHGFKLGKSVPTTLKRFIPQ